MSPTYWELIADEIRNAGWSLGWHRVCHKGVMLWHADATKHDGRRFIARADELAVAMLELQKMTRDT